MAPDAPTRTISWYEDLSDELKVVIPAPTITGPYFDSLDEWVTRDTHESKKGQYEITQLQKYLKKYGYYKADCAGWYGPMTEKAVTDFQRMLGLTVDGIAGPETKGMMVAPRFDDHVDFEESVRNFEKGQEVTY